MDRFWSWLREFFTPEHVFGYLICSAGNVGLVRKGGKVVGWGGKLNTSQPSVLFFHPKSSLQQLRAKVVGYTTRPAYAYPAILARDGKITVTGGPFDFWRMATWTLPPGSPYGPEPERRTEHTFMPGTAVWFLHKGWWKKGTAVSSDRVTVYIALGDGTVVNCWYTGNIVWPRAW